jgi:hypothetical protein
MKLLLLDCKKTRKVTILIYEYHGYPEKDMDSSLIH